MNPICNFCKCTAKANGFLGTTGYSTQWSVAIAERATKADQELHIQRSEQNRLHAENSNDVLPDLLGIYVVDSRVLNLNEERNRTRVPKSV